MDKEEIAKKLSEFDEYLNISNLFSDAFRWLGWIMIKGIALLVDSLEKVTDEVLLVKAFFQNPEVVAFVESIRPFLYVILSLNLLWAGYMLVFQKKFDREGIAINLFIALTVVALLGNGMQKVNDFTDEAINTVKSDHLYEKEINASLSDIIIQRNVTDLVMFDKKGWNTTKLDSPNDFPPSKAKNVSITQRFTKSDLNEVDIKISSTGDDISKHYLTLGEGGIDKIAKFDQGGLEWNNEYYYRYDINWLTLVVTLVVMGFTLFSIAYKLARLAFELTFNYVLAIIVAPADVHDGQKTKAILQSIFNTFLVIILIFLSMKIYIVGTAYLANNIEGFAYLIALIAFSVALIDGPNIVERLFGIDAGLKNGWGVLATAYAGGKALEGLGGSLSGVGKQDIENSNKLSASKKGNDKAKSPNGNKGKKVGVNANDTKNKKGAMDVGNSSKGITTTHSGISAQLEQIEQQERNRQSAPSPNDSERLGASKTVQTSTGGVRDTVVGKTSNNGSQMLQEGSGEVTSVSEQQGNANIRETGSSISPSSNTNVPNVSATSVSGSQSRQTASVQQTGTTQVDTEVTSVSEQHQGNTNIRETGSSASPTTVTTASNANISSAAQSSVSGSQSRQTASVQQTGTTQVDTEVTSITDNQQGNTSVREISSGNAGRVSINTNSPTSDPDVQHGRNETHSQQTVKMEQSSISQVNAEVTATNEQIIGTTMTHQASVISQPTNEQSQQYFEPNHSENYTRLRPKKYETSRRKSTDGIKSFKKK